MRTSATVTKADGSMASASTSSLIDQEPGALEVPIRELAEDGAGGIALGFRQEMLGVEGMGSVCTGAGLGTDFIILEWKGRTAFVRGSELLKSWVSTFAPDDAAQFPESVR